MKILSFTLLLLLAFLGSYESKAQPLLKEFVNNDFKKVIQSKKNFESEMLLTWSHEANLNDSLATEAMFSYIKSQADPSPYIFVFLNQDFMLKPEMDKAYLRQREICEELLTIPQLNVTAKARLNFTLRSLYEFTRAFDKIPQTIEQIGAIDKWQIVGGFDNTSGSGFHKAYGVLENPKGDKAMRNALGVPIEWFSVPAIYNKMILKFDYLDNVQNRLFYAQSFINSLEEQEVYFNLSFGGATKIWINDQLLLAEEKELNTDFDTFRVKVKLHKGGNRLLIQVGASEKGACNFLARFTKNDFEIAKNLTFSDTYISYTKSNEGLAPKEVFFAERFFNEKSKADPEDMIAAVMLADVYKINNDFEKAIGLLVNLKTKYPSSVFIRSKLTDLYADASLDNLKEIESKEIIKEFDQTSIGLIAKLVHGKEDLTIEEQKNAIEKLDILGVHPRFILAKNLMIHVQENNMDKIIENIEMLWTMNPYDREMQASMANYKAERSNNPDDYNAVLNHFLEKYYDDNVIDLLSSKYIELGRVDEAYEMYKKRIEISPYASGYYSKLGSLYSRKLDFENAIVYYKKALEFSPYFGNSWYNLGICFQKKGDKSKAIECFEKAATLEPDNFETYEAIRKLKNQRSRFALFSKIEIDKVINNDRKDTKYVDKDSYYVKDEVRRFLTKEGGLEAEYEILIKVNTQVGIDLWKESSVYTNENSETYEIKKAEIIKPNDNRIDADINNNQIVFTGLEKGDYIYLTYTLQKYAGTDKLWNHFNERRYFSSNIPKKQTTYSLILPKSRKFDVRQMNMDLIPTTESMDEYMMYTWDLRGTEMEQEEPYMPSYTDMYKCLEISTIPDWNYVAKWYSDLASPKAKADFEIKKVIQDLFPDGVDKLTEMERAKHIYDYIESNISYLNVSFLQSAFVPQSAATTLEQKMGDCKDLSTLFNTLCKEVGLETNLVLVNTRENGDQTLWLPGTGFNHCISRVKLNGKYHFVELTDNFNAFLNLSAYLIKAQILIIPNLGEQQEYQLTELNQEDRISNSVFRKTSLKIEDKDFQIESRNIKTGVFGSYIRGAYVPLEQDKKEEELLLSQSRSFSNAVENLEIDFSKLDIIGDSAFYDYSFNVKNEVSKVAGMNIFKMPWNDREVNTNLVSIENRKYPILFWSYNHGEIEDEELTINLPAGTRLLEEPESLIYDYPFASYELIFTKVSDTQFIMHRKFERKSDQISLTDYKDFRIFFTAMVEADNRQYAYK